jgi:serine/threonine protein kinase
MASSAPEETPACASCGASCAINAKFCGKCGAPVSVNSPQPGEVIAQRYRLGALLGRGAMGLVYRAEHVNMGKPLAVKLLHRELEVDPDNVARFHREAEAASKLSHPNTVQVFDFGRSENGWLYLAMELVDGDDLGQILEREGPLPFARVARICAQVAASVQDAHSQGIVHRDLKPENIVVTEGSDGELAKVLDFGLAKLFQSPADVQLTSAGTIVGTPFYMSPEQIRGRAVDGRSDIYSLGAIMYQAVVGSPPFDAPSPMALLSKHLSEAPVPPSTASSLPVPAEADRIIERCLHKDPELRYESADALRRDLLAYLATLPYERGDFSSGIPSQPSPPMLSHAEAPIGDIPTAKSRWRSLWMALGLLAVAGFGLWQYLSSGPVEHEPNHDPDTATPLQPYVGVRAFLGQRLDEGSGDVDLFKFAYQSDPPGAVMIELTAIPNIDTVLELLRPGQDTPIVASDFGGKGEGERLPNVPLEPGTYFVRVRERTVAGELPTENVSDPYHVHWEPLELLENFEREPNDSLGFSETLPLDAERRAWIGWRGDTDVFCLGENAERVVAQLSPVSDLDLVLRVLERETESGRRYNRRGVGRAESTRVLRNVNAGELCVEVSAREDAGGGRSANPYESYGVRFKTAASR